MPRRVLVSTRYFDAAGERALVEGGCEVVRTGLPDNAQDDTLPPERLDELLAGVAGWIVGTAPVTRARLAAHPGLRIIARRGVGYDTVDVEAVRALGRTLTIAPGGNEPAVADHAVGMMLALAKRLREGHLALQADRWSPLVGTELYGKTVGLIGLGRIARAVARRMTGFDGKVIAYDPMVDAETASSAGVRLVGIEELLAQSDYISLHLPLTPETRHVIDAEALARTKPGVILVNTARGGLIDETALADGLATGHVGGAGLDVFEGEADPEQRASILRLLAAPNVIATAHAAGSSREGLERTNVIAAHCVIDALNGELPPRHCVVVEGALKTCGSQTEKTE
jgi:D-3-phosphoglycerate dehydrogenase